MKKSLMLFAIVVFVGSAEIQAFKKAVKVPATTGERRTPAAQGEMGVPAIKPGKPAVAKRQIVITEAKKKQLEAEMEKALREMHRVHNTVVTLAMSLGNQEDAQAFYDEMDKRFSEKGDMLGEPKRPDFSSLSSKQPVARQPLTEAHKAAILKLAKSWKKDDAMKKYDEYLDKHNLEFDDTFIGEIYQTYIP